MCVSIVVILIMVSLNAPSLLTRNGLTRPRLSSLRGEAVVVAEIEAAAEVTLQDKAMGMVIKPIPVTGGRAMMLRCL